VKLFPRGECHKQNHPDRTNLRILNFVDNKDLHGGGLSESLTSVPVTDGTQLVMKIKPPLPTHFSNNVCLCTLDFKPRLAIRLFFCPSYYFARSSPCHYFFASTVILFTPRRRTNEQTSKRANEQTSKRANEQTSKRANERTNGNSFLLMSRSSFAYHY
jgi:hypothetical protein